jgi:hypothetical protein
MELITGISLFLLTGASAIGGFFLYKKITPPALPAPASHSTQLLEHTNFSTFEVGSILKLLNYGESMEDYDLQVVRKDVFSESGKEWFQYEAKGSDQAFFFHVLPDTAWQPYILVETCTLETLGLSENEIRNFRAMVTGSFTYKEISFFYKTAGSAFLRYQDSGPKRIDYWYFYSSDEQHFLKIERLDPRMPLVVAIFEALPAHKYEFL